MWWSPSLAVLTVFRGIECFVSDFFVRNLFVTIICLREQFFGHFCLPRIFCPMVRIDFVLVGCMGILSMFSSILINQWVVHVDIMFS